MIHSKEYYCDPSTFDKIKTHQFHDHSDSEFIDMEMFLFAEKYGIVNDIYRFCCVDSTCFKSKSNIYQQKTSFIKIIVFICI